MEDAYYNLLIWCVICGLIGFGFWVLYLIVEKPFKLKKPYIVVDERGYHLNIEKRQQRIKGLERGSVKWKN